MCELGVAQSVIDDGTSGADVSMPLFEPQDILNIHRDID